MMKLLVVATLALVSSCTTERDGMSQLRDDLPQLELLTFEGCPNSPQMRKNVREAIAELDWDVTLIETRLTSLAPNDDRLRYGAPTLLVDGVDLLRQPPGEDRQLNCRIYPAGVPSSREIANQLRQRR